MSNSAYTDVNATNEELNEFLSSNQSAAPKKNNVLYRLLAFVFAVAPIVLLCVLPMPLFLHTSGFSFDVFSGKLTDILISLFSGELGGSVVDKLFGFLPVFALQSTTGLFNPFYECAMWFETIAFYGMLICLVLSFVLAFIAILSRKAAPALARAIAWINFWAVGGFMMSVYTCLYLYGFDYAAITTNNLSLFLVPLGIVAGLGLFGFILSVIKAPKHVWVSTILFIFAVAFNVVSVYAISYFSLLTAKPEVGNIYLYATYAFLGLSALGLLITSATLAKTKGFGGNLFTAIIQLVATIAALVAYIINMDTLSQFPLVIKREVIDFQGALACLIAFGALAILGLIFSIVRLCVARKAAVAAYIAEHGMTKEEEKEKDYVDGVPYQATFARQAAEETAVEEEEVEEEEEEVAPAPVAAAPAPVATTSQVDDKTKINDEFIATLSAEERKQFADIFMLKSKGDFVGIPDYKTGEDNKEFFRKIFVHLGQYRARIPDELLGKIYDFYTDKY